jgi:hypothetical protein
MDAHLSAAAHLDAGYLDNADLVIDEGGGPPSNAAAVRAATPTSNGCRPRSNGACPNAHCCRSSRAPPTG